MPVISASASADRPTASISKSASAPAPMSAVKRLRCWKASKAVAALSAPSRRCRHIGACSPGTMPIQLAGNIRYGGLFETTFGITLGELIDDIGGGTLTGRPVRAVQVGGPLGAYFPRALFDTPFDYEAFTARDGLIGHGGIVVFDDSVDMSKQARFAMEFCAVESCGKCTPCRIGSTRGVETIDKVMAGEKVEKNLAIIEDLCNTMK